MTFNTVDPAEIEHFSRMAEEWWDPHGKFKPLHRMNPVRIAYIRDQVLDTSPNTQHLTPNTAQPLQGLRILDIGCGGGLIAEPMARLGASVTAIDASEKNISVARLHAKQSGLDINYRCTTAEALLTENPEPFDAVLALEIIEHVADINAFTHVAMQLVKPGGTAIFSTLNRTLKSFALAIVGAEYVLRWLPAGTHSWEKFLKPSELVPLLERHGGKLTDMTGMVMSPLTFDWRLDAKDVSVNYIVTVGKAG